MRLGFWYAVDALGAADSAVATEGQVKFIRIDTVTTKTSSRNASTTTHSAVLRFESGNVVRELLEFPNQQFKDSDYKELDTQVSTLVKSATVTAYCSSASSACFLYPGVETGNKLGLLISLAGFALFVFLARKAKAESSK